jgi:predicted alpha/beta-fold hydrolase
MLKNHKTRAKRKNPLKSVELFTSRADVLLASPLDFNLPVKILIHGFLSDSKSTFARKVRETYVAVQGVNVVAVDWSGIAAVPDYELTFRNTRKVRKRVSSVEKFNFKFSSDFD